MAKRKRTRRGLGSDHHIRTAADDVERAVADGDCDGALSDLLAVALYAGYTDDPGSPHQQRAEDAYRRSCMCAPRTQVGRRNVRRRRRP